VANAATLISRKKMERRLLSIVSKNFRSGVPPALPRNQIFIHRSGQHRFAVKECRTEIRKKSSKILKCLDDGGFAQQNKSRGRVYLVFLHMSCQGVLLYVHTYVHKFSRLLFSLVPSVKFFVDIFKRAKSKSCEVT
jgi:hypothetical protein